MFDLILKITLEGGELGEGNKLKFRS